MAGKHHKLPWWRRSDRRQGIPQPRRPHLTEIVDGQGAAHLVTGEAFERGLVERTGRYQAVCLRSIAVTSMVAAPTSYCRPCQVLGVRP